MGFDPISYILGAKYGGGGGGVTVEPLSVSENGTYTAPSGKAYSPVSVNVGAPVVDESKPIRFYDYDGTPLYSYDYTELATLTELPAQPVHPGLTATGWNWTLADIKAENAPVIVGGHYRTTDGKHKFYIHIENDDQRKIDLYFRLQGTAEVDWGDGSEIESIEWNMSLTAKPPLLIHEYDQTGDYCIGIKVLTGYISGAYNNDPLLKYAYREDLITTQSGLNISANALLTRIEGGDDTKMDYAWFSAFAWAYNLQSVAVPSRNWWIADLSYNQSLVYCRSLKYISVPHGVTTLPNCQQCSELKTISIPKSIKTIPDNTFNTCSTMKSVTILAGVTSIGNAAFQNCKSLKSFTIPSSVTSIGNNMFSNSSLSRVIIEHGVPSIGSNMFSNTSLTSLTIPSSVTIIGNNACTENSLLTSVKIPSSVTSIGNQAFHDCKNVYLYDFTTWTTADLDACTFGTNIFQSLLAGTQILFKYKSVADHAATITNLSTYASYMTYEEDDT